MSKKVIPFSTFVKVNSAALMPPFTFNRLNGLIVSAASEPMPEYSEYYSLSAVAAAYGVESKEYKAASVYFGYVSKQGVTPERLSFWNYNKDGFKAALKGGTVTDLAKIKVSGKLNFVTEEAEEEISLDLTSVTSFSEAAEKMQEQLKEKATVYYSSISQSFIIEAKETGTSKSILYCEDIDEDGNNLATLLCLTKASGAYEIAGKDKMNISEVLNRIGEYNGNYYTISFLDNIEPATDFKIMSEFSASSKGRYMVVANDNNKSNILQSLLYSDLFNNGGFVYNYSDSSNINALTQGIVASIDYSRIQGAVNVNFIPVSQIGSYVVDTEQALQNINNQRANCIYNVGGYGQSTLLYGEGNMFGSDFKDISGYTGNSWLKAKLEIAIMNLFISTPLVSLRGAGFSLIFNTVTAVMDEALKGGIVTVAGKGNLTKSEENAIIAQTGDENAVTVIEMGGYFIQVEPITDDDIANKKVRLKVLYTRNTPVNRVEVSVLMLG